MTSIEAVVARGVAASQVEDSDEAIARFREASTLAPSTALPQFLLGAELAARGDMFEAEAAYANAVRLAPGFAIARFQLGLLQYSSGRAAMGLLTWQPLFELPSTDPLRGFVEGFAALAQDRFQVALAHFSEGLSHNTSNPALSADIELVMTRVRSLIAQQDASGESAGDTLSEASEAHVLLANYQRGN